MPGADLRGVLRPALSPRSSAQVVAEELIPGVVAGRRGTVVVDLGCGRGDSVNPFREADPDVRWTGLELEGFDGERPTRTDIEFRVYDGTRMPFADAGVDIVFCKQVVEH